MKDKLKVGLIGTNHLSNVLNREDVLATAICDSDPKRIDIALNKISEAGEKKPEVFSSNELDY